MDSISVKEEYLNKHIRDLLEGVSIAYIPRSRNGQDFGSKGWGTGKTKLLVAKKNGSWCLYIFETCAFEKESELLKKDWFNSLSKKERESIKTFADLYAKWQINHPVSKEDVDVAREAINQRILRISIVQNKGSLLKVMKPDASELDDAEVIQLFSLFDPDFDNIRNEPNDLNIYGDLDFVFMDERYSCIAGMEGLSFTEAEEVCKRMIVGE